MAAIAGLYNFRDIHCSAVCVPVFIQTCKSIHWNSFPWIYSVYGIYLYGLPSGPKTEGLWPVATVHAILHTDFTRENWTHHIVAFHFTSVWYIVYHVGQTFWLILLTRQMPIVKLENFLMLLLSSIDHKPNHTGLELPGTPFTNTE